MEHQFGAFIFGCLKHDEKVLLRRRRLGIFSFFRKLKI